MRILRKKLDVANCDKNLLAAIIVAMQTIEHKTALFCEMADKAICAAENAKRLG